MRMNLPTTATIPRILAGTTLPSTAPYPIPQSAQEPVAGAVSGDAPASEAAPLPAFVWGDGGRRMTPEEIALGRAQAEQMEAAGMDFSPVASWTQGAARVMQGLVGGIERRHANKAADANAEHSRTVTDALMNPSAGPGIDNRTIVSLLADPYLDPSAKVAGKALLEANLTASHPFTIGRDRVQYDPATGQSHVVYDGSQDFEDYAATLGLKPGSPEYFKAVEDFVLKGHGPSALERDTQLDDRRTSNDRALQTDRYGNQVSLEKLRQGNRVGMEGVRQGNRTTLRETPSYSDLHPHARTGGASRPSATGKNGERIEWNGKAWVGPDGKPVG